jgi:hypothetical protein
VVQLKIVEHMAYAKVYVVKKYFMWNYVFYNHMSSKSSKHMKKLTFILLCTSYHNHYINWKNVFFAHCAPFINMTMGIYVFLLLGWRCYVHMMCLIPMLIPPHPKPKNL